MRSGNAANRGSLLRQTSTGLCLNLANSRILIQCLRDEIAHAIMRSDEITLQQQGRGVILGASL